MHLYYPFGKRIDGFALESPSNRDVAGPDRIQFRVMRDLREATSGVRLDDTDKAIIGHLQDDGRIPYAKLGPAVGLSAAAVRQRVLALIEHGVMQIVAVTDPRACTGCQICEWLCPDFAIRVRPGGAAAQEAS